MKNTNRMSTSVHPSVSATLTNISDDKRQNGTYNTILFVILKLLTNSHDYIVLS